MAVKIGKELGEGSFKMYKGIAGFNIVAVNPTKAELDALTGREHEKEPEYLTKTEDGIPQVRVTFYAKTATNAAVNNGINLLVPITFTITNAPNIGAKSGKCQVIDKYGRTAWASREDYDAHAIPTYTSGPANISSEYRKALKGEEYLIKFLIKWLNIPAAADYKNGKWVDKADQTDSEVSLNMEALLKGDVSELRTLVEAAPTFVIKAAVGIKTVEGEKGARQYHTVFAREFAKNSVTDYSSIDAAIVEYQNGGGAPNTLFSVQPLHEHKVVATEFVASDAVNTPAASATPWD